MLSGDIFYFCVLCCRRNVSFCFKLEFHIAITKYENIHVDVIMSA